MTITDVQSCVIGRDEKHSGGSIWTFVRIYTDDGIVGSGECNSAGVDYSGFATKEAVPALRPHLIGQDPANMARFMKTCDAEDVTAAPIRPRRRLH